MTGRVVLGMVSVVSERERDLDVEPAVGQHQLGHLDPRDDIAEPLGDRAVGQS
jgi:hypothetical protein